MASLYVHIPFCEKKCLYCDFYSIENLSAQENFLRALHKEIELYAAYGAKEEFETVFFGGGTPSLLSPRELEAILTQLSGMFRLTHDAEVTVETNPGTVTEEKLCAYRSIGVNRLSIGIQSFHQDELRFLSRIHNAKQAIQCVEFARSAGFENVSLDLIYALPDQSIEQWALNLQTALTLRPDHISAYGLIVEEHTPLARLVAAGIVTPKPAEDEARFFELTMNVLESNGYEHYEVSNYAKPGFRSRHNYNYWRHENYLGFGPSAHSFWKEGQARRWANIANLSQYCEQLNNRKAPLVSDETLTAADLVVERVFLGLRSDGANISETGIASHIDSSLIPELVSKGLACIDGDRLHLTSKGFLLCDEIAVRLLSPAVPGIICEPATGESGHVHDTEGRNGAQYHAPLSLVQPPAPTANQLSLL